VDWAEYGVGAWDDHRAARDLFSAIRQDAAEQDVDRVRMLIPEHPTTVSDTAYARVPVSDEPDFVLARDLTEPLERRD
ncbi:MAG: GNAT family N-acetyltransferase, partial [Halobacteriaceae archaeon]